MSKRLDKKVDDRSKDGHHTEKVEGDYCLGSGYTKKGNEYLISPGRAQIMDDCVVRRRGLANYIADVNTFVMRAYIDIAEQEQKWWDDRKVGMELPDEINFMYDSSRRRIYPAPPKKAEPHD